VCSNRLLDHLVRPPSSDCGIVRPSALAVLRLMTSSNFVGCSTEIGGLGALQDLIDIDGGTAPQRPNIPTVGKQTTSSGPPAGNAVGGGPAPPRQQPDPSKRRGRTARTTRACIDPGPSWRKRPASARPPEPSIPESPCYGTGRRPPHQRVTLVPDGDHETASREAWPAFRQEFDRFSHPWSRSVSYCRPVEQARSILATGSSALTMRVGLLPSRCGTASLQHSPGGRGRGRWFAFLR